MKVTNRRIRPWAACAVVAAVVLAPVAIRAEVAVVAPPGARPSSIWLAQIVDGPDPVPTIWAPLSTAPERIALNPGGDANGDGPPSIAGHPAGACLVAWSKNTPGGRDVVASRFETGGWTVPEPLASTSADEVDPFVLQAPDGSFHLFYWEAGATPRVLYRNAPPDLSSWSPAVQVSDSGLAACRPHATFHQGVLRVIFEVHDYGYQNTPRQVVIARYENGAFVAEVLAITQNLEPVWPQIHARGARLWADWEDAPGQMLWTARDDSTGIWGSVQAEPYTTEEQRSFFVRGTIQSLASD